MTSQLLKPNSDTIKRKDNFFLNCRRISYSSSEDGGKSSRHGDQYSSHPAPQATAAITGGSDLYGAIVVKKLTEAGGAAIHYDRNLANTAMAAGNFMMSAFTWKNY